MTFKFISLNLWHGGKLLDEIFEFLNKEQPDILVTQEAWNSADTKLPAHYRSIETLQKYCRFEHADFAKALLDSYGGIRVPSGNAVFSRWPLSAHPAIFYDQPYGERTFQNHESFSNTPRNLQHATIHTPQTDLNIFNTQGVWDLDGDRASEQRKKMCKAISEAVRGKRHTVLAGDFNLKPTNQALAPLDATLNSVFKDELATTFNVKRKDLKKYPGYATAVVDLMYISADIEVLNHSCPDVDASDHLPLVAELQIK